MNPNTTEFLARDHIAQLHCEAEHERLGRRVHAADARLAGRIARLAGRVSAFRRGDSPVASGTSRSAA